MVRISSGRASDLETGVPPTVLVKPMAIQLSAMTKGEKIQAKNSSGRAKIMASFSACWVAIVLGVVSVKISRKAVSPIVA
ncbi:hypothetical protein ES707_15808 [subsurface metagenome]